MRATTGGVWSQYPSSVVPLKCLSLQVVRVHGPLVMAGHAHSGVRDNCCGLPLPPVDHSKKHLICLALTGGAVPAASSCRVFERTVIKHLGAAQSTWQWELQGWCVPKRVKATMCGAWLQRPLPLPSPATPYVAGASGGAHLQVPSGAGHTSLWPPRGLPRSFPDTACRSRKRYHVALSPLLPLAHTELPGTLSLHKKPLFSHSQTK